MILLMCIVHTKQTFYYYYYYYIILLIGGGSPDDSYPIFWSQFLSYVFITKFNWTRHHRTNT